MRENHCLALFLELTRAREHWCWCIWGSLWTGLPSLLSTPASSFPSGMCHVPSALPCPTILGGIWVFLVPQSPLGMSSPGMLNEERDSLGSHEDQIKNGGGAKQRWGISLQVMSFTWSSTAYSISKPAEHRGAGFRSLWLSHVIRVLQILFSPGEEKLTRVTVLPSSLWTSRDSGWSHTAVQVELVIVCLGCC